jgi:hypothetical protein
LEWSSAFVNAISVNSSLLLMRIFYFTLLLPLASLIDQAAAQTPLFDSGASTIIGGNTGPYNNVVNINAASGTETFYFAIGTGNGSNNAPWTSGNTVTALNLALWGFSPSGNPVPVTVGLYTGPDSGSGLSGLTAIGGPQTQNINNTSGGNYTNTASTFSFGLTGAAQTANPITPNTEFIVGVTVSTGNAFDLATGPLVGSPQPNYTFNNAFTGSTGIDTNSYFYTANNGDVSGVVLSHDTGLAAFADLTATVTPVPEPPLGHYLLLSLPLVVGATLARWRRPSKAS